MLSNRKKERVALFLQVMDPRTRMILFKLLNQGFFRQIDGCLSTGKEANVYYAVGGEVMCLLPLACCSCLWHHRCR